MWMLHLAAGYHPTGFQATAVVGKHTRCNVQAREFNNPFSLWTGSDGSTGIPRSEQQQKLKPETNQMEPPRRSILEEMAQAAKAVSNPERIAALKAEGVNSIARRIEVADAMEKMAQAAAEVAAERIATLKAEGMNTIARRTQVAEAMSTKLQVAPAPSSPQPEPVASNPERITLLRAAGEATIARRNQVAKAMAEMAEADAVLE